MKGTLILVSMLTISLSVAANSNFALKRCEKLLPADVLKYQEANDAFFQKLLKLDFRKNLLMLETLTRNYVESKDDPIFVKIKTFEDYLGSTVDADKIAKKLVPELPPEAGKILQQDFENKKQDLLSFLNKNKNFSQTVKTFFKNLNLSEKQDQKIILKNFSKLLSKIEEPLNLDKLEEGIHELRRRIRSTMLEAQSLRGAIITSKSLPGPKSLDDRYLKNTIDSDIQERIIINNDVKVPTPCAISFSSYAALGEVVLKLGKIKDDAFLLEKNYQSLKESGGNPDQSKYENSLKKLISQAKLVAKFLFDSKAINHLLNETQDCQENLKDED